MPLPSSWDELLLLAAALKTNLLNVLIEQKTARDVSNELGLSPRATEIVLEALASLGYLERSDGHYKISPQTKAFFVDKESSYYVANSLMHSRKLIENWLKLDKAIVSGKSQTRGKTQEELEYFIGSMAENAMSRAEQVISYCLEENAEAKEVLDVGGGPGVYAQEFAKRGLKVTLFDLPKVIDLIKGEILSDKITLVSGDFNQWLPSLPAGTAEKHFDIVFLGNVCHIYSPVKLESLFKKVAKIMSKNSILAIVDLVRGISPRAEVFAVNMLVSTAGGGTWTKQQYGRWLKEAGLRLTKTRNLLDSHQQLMIGKQ